MENILIVGLVQYGYNTDWYKYSELLSERYNVYYLCRSATKPLISSNKVNVIYFDASNRDYYIKILGEVKKLKKHIDFKKVFVYVYPLCSLMRLLFSKEQLIMDIRTSYIKSPIATWICNKLIKWDSVFYGKISVISWGVADFLNLNKKKCCYLPLGGEALGYYPKDMSSLKLFYVGTFYDRNIEKTIEGLSIFKKNNPDSDVSYTIVGVGSSDEISKIRNTISSYSLEDCVHFIGEKRGEELINLFKRHNVGVSYIPLTDYYDCQPPTKTFEYLLASMLVLATPTSENAKVINNDNGKLCNSDTPEDFASALSFIYENRMSYDLKDVYSQSLMYSWKFIVENYLLKIVL